MENENDVMTESPEMTQEVTAEVTESSVSDETTEVLTPEDVERLVNEAEERGYLRGRNEAVDALMERPGCKKTAEQREEESEEDAVMILREMRRSVWD